MGVAIGLSAVALITPPNPAYPPTATGDHGALPFIFTAALLGVISLLVGFVSIFGFFNYVAKKGPKRRFFRYTSPCIDIIFVLITPVAMWVSKAPFHLWHHIAFSPPPGEGSSLVIARLTHESFQYTHSNLGDEGTQCYANMGTYKACGMLVVAMVMTGPGALAAVFCAWFESRRIKNRWETS